MGKKRVIVEIGTGVDLHGQDPTAAAVRAVKDAIARSCLCALQEILHIQNPEEVQVDVAIASPITEGIDREAVLAALPFGRKSLTVTKGGMLTPGLFVEKYGDKTDEILVANAAVTVSIEGREARARRA